MENNSKPKQLKTVILWIKANFFYIVSITLGVVGFVVAGVSLTNASDRYARQAMELERIRQLHLEEMARHQQIEQRYTNLIKQIEQEKKEEIGRLTNRQREDIRIIVAETGDDPELMRSRVAAILGTGI